MKDKIRKELIQIRKNMSKKDILEKSKQIKNKLFEMKEFKQASTILFYVSYDNEVYTHEMIKECISHKKIIVPVSDKKNRCLILSQLDSWDDLKPGSYGILEPQKNKIKKISIEKIDIAIVPGVGFDEKGNRLGHGKGYYDNLLNRSKVLKIALALEFQIIENIPTSIHDIPVNKIVTEDRIIDCT